jgi:hypothetical protein
MASNKHDIDLAKIDATRQKTLAVVGMISTFFKVAGFVLAAKFFMDGLEQIVLGKPESISALAKLAEAMNLGTVSGYLLAGGIGLAWDRERRGKKRAIQKYATIKRLHGPNESTSGLTDTGDTPDED